MNDSYPPIPVDLPPMPTPPGPPPDRRIIEPGDREHPGAQAAFGRLVALLRGGIVAERAPRRRCQGCGQWLIWPDDRQTCRRCLRADWAARGGRQPRGRS